MYLFTDSKFLIAGMLALWAVHHWVNAYIPDVGVAANDLNSGYFARLFTFSCGRIWKPFSAHSVLIRIKEICAILCADCCGGGSIIVVSSKIPLMNAMKPIGKNGEKVHVKVVELGSMYETNSSRESKKTALVRFQI